MPHPAHASAPRRSVLRALASAALRRVARAPRARRHAFHYEGVLGTSLELQVVAASADAAHAAESAVLEEIDRLAGILSGYAPTSELSRWLATRGEPVAVSPELADVLDAAEAWRARTGGAFNPAAASLVELLGDRATDPARAPDDRTRAVRERLLEMDRPLWTVDRVRGVACRLTRLPVSLDALAKGYVVDLAAARARDVDGVTEVLVNVGGDLRHLGERPLVVGVADPRAPAENAPPIAAVRLRGEALATSGGYRRGFTMAGRAVSHILDPRDGRPAERVISASVVAPDCATADALSTAFSVLAPAESVALADATPGAGCLLVERDGAVTTSAAWRARAAPWPTA